MSTNKFWFRNVETMDRITVFIDTEFKLCDNFLTIYQLQAFAQSDDSEFITSELNKNLGFTLAEFNNCSQICLTTLPEQYELYFQVQPHTKPEVETLFDDGCQAIKNNAIKDHHKEILEEEGREVCVDVNATYYPYLYFKNDELLKEFRSKIDETQFYSVNTLELAVMDNHHDSQFHISWHGHYLTIRQRDEFGWSGPDLIDRCDNGARITDGSDGFHVYLPKWYLKKDVEAKKSDPVKKCVDTLDKKLEEYRKTNEIPKQDPNEPIPERGYILDMAKKTVCNDRQDQYGDPEDSFDLIADYWTIYIRSKYPEFTKVLSREDVAWMMNLLKIARQCGGQGKLDNSIDAAGYAAIAGEMWRKGKKK